MTDRLHRRNRVGLAVAALVVSAATLFTTPLPAHSTASAATPGTDGGWSIVDPATVGMDATVLDGARDYAFAPGKNTQGVVVTRAGHIAAEWYASDEGPRSWAASWSMAKSIASILVGIAIDEGKITSVDESMATWFPDWAGTPKAAVTLADVLHMESGLESTEDYDPAHLDQSTVIQMGLSANQLAFSAARPLVTTPGTVFNYSSADAMLLSRVLQVATGESVADFAQQKLFGPLGIRQVEWWSDAAGNTLTYCCTDTTTRDFARIGMLYANDGDWNGHQIVSASWVHESLTPTTASEGHYGYMWWLTTAPGVDGPIAVMNGHDGQFVYVIPQLQMVVARNGYYVKSACPAVADPNLFGLYPPNGLVPDAGTHPPDSWDANAFLEPIIQSVTGPAGAATFPDPEPVPESRDPDGQAMAPCADQSTPTAQPVAARPAAPVQAQPTFTG